MTNDEHDAAILAKCREITNWPQVAPTMKALALSTIAAIEGLHKMPPLDIRGRALAAIRAAWPVELLNPL